MTTLRLSVVVVLILTRCTAIDLESEFLLDRSYRRRYSIRLATRSLVLIRCF